MDKPTAQSYNETIDEVLAAWTEFALRALRDKLKERKMVMTAELANSLSFLITKANTAGQAKTQLAVKNYGRYKDMRRLTYTKPANFDAMLEFVKKIGLAAFQYVPGYNTGGRPSGRIPTTSTAMNRIAWGVAWSRYIKYRHRRRQWLNKFFYGPVVGQLINSLVEKTGSTAVQIIEAELNDAFSS